MVQRRILAAVAAATIVLAAPALTACSSDDSGSGSGSTSTAAGHSGAGGGGSTGKAAPAKTPAAKKAAPAQSDWYTKEWGTFATSKKAGRSAAVVALPKGAKAGMVKMTYHGSSNFSVEVLDSSNQSTGDLLANTIGSYAGTSAFGLSDLGKPVKLKVSASGPWTISIAPISSAKSLPKAGRGDGVYRYDGKATTWKISNKGDGNFTVDQVSDDLIPNLAVNEIGNYKGDVPAVDGPSVVTVASDGTWTIRSS
jgi:hypothetical protein